MIDKTKFTEILPGLYYENSTGLPWSSKKKGRHLEKFNDFVVPLIGKLVGGYHQIWYEGHKYLWHRKVYEHFNGIIPKNKVIDHFDNNRTNNLKDNLFLSICSANNQKSKKHTNNTSGFPGVQKTVRESGNIRYVSHITINSKSIHLGSFNTPEEAYKVYLDAKVKHHGVDSIKPLEKKEG